ncbi:MAG: GNAT family N-acetyltransferase [Bacteriovoracaceae bacterium]|jgi:hypothetical protein|nr:GNAT family N-acetyltransferase [Bacteriovoracaceae bacterium]
MKIVDDFILFEPETYNDVTKAIVDESMQKHGKETFVVLPQKVDLDDLEYLKEEFKDSYFIQLGFIQEPSKVSFSNDDVELIEEKNYRVQSEIIDDIQNTYGNEMSEDWAKYIPEYKHKENMKYLSDLSTLEASYALIDPSSKELAGVVTTFDHKFCTGEPLEQISWVWVNQSLNNNKKNTARNMIIKWLANRKSTLFQAGVHIENIKSQKFFLKMGFIPKCAHISKR